MTHLILRNIKIPAAESDASAFSIVHKKLKSVGLRPVGECYIHRRSVDARKRDNILLVMSVGVTVEQKIGAKQLEKLDAVVLEDVTPVFNFGKTELTDRPLIVALASNDAMSQNLANIAALMNRKAVYFVPMVQDSPMHKPHSLVADFSLLPAVLVAAMRAEQMRPVFLEPHGAGA